MDARQVFAAAAAAAWMTGVWPSPVGAEDTPLPTCGPPAYINFYDNKGRLVTIDYRRDCVNTGSAWRVEEPSGGGGAGGTRWKEQLVTTPSDLCGFAPGLGCAVRDSSKDPIMVKNPDEALIKSIEKAVLEVLADKDLDPADKIKAIQAGTQLIAVKNKLKDGDKPANFFGGKE